MPRKEYHRLIPEGLESLKAYEQDGLQFGRLSGKLFDGDDDDPESVGLVFQAVTIGLTDSPADDPVVRLFRDAGLNFYDPYDWSIIVAMFATVHYKKRPQGRPKVQDVAFARTLKRRVKQIVEGSPPVLNDHQLAKLFFARFGPSYPTIRSIGGIVSMFRTHGLSLKDYPARKSR